jgi:hypothetical protein
MLRSILGIVLGVIAGGVVVGLIEATGMLIHPPPPGVSMFDTAAMKEHAAKAPPAALVPVGVAWTIGPFVAALVAALIAGRAHVLHGLVIGAIFVVLDLINIVSFPHPLWLTVVGVLAPPLSGWLGAALARRLGRASAGPAPYDMREKNMAC